MSLSEAYRICVSIKAGTVKEALEMLNDASVLSVDLVEVRLDYMKGFQGLSRLPGSTGLPLIAAFRPRRQGGLYDGDERKRVATLLEAAEAGFDYVDVELDTEELETVVERLKQAGARVMVSHHDFDRTPSLQELRWLLSMELSYEPDVCKIVPYAKTLKDNLTCLDLLAESGGRVKLVCFAMGKLGLPSRILSPIYGGFFTFAALRRGLETAPGQLTIEELRSVVRFIAGGVGCEGGR